MRWLKEYWPETVPVLVLLVWKNPFRHTGELSDLWFILPLLAVGLTVLVVGLRYVGQYQRPLTTALWVMAVVVLVTSSILPILFDLRPYFGSWPWFMPLASSLAAWAMVVWLSGRLARHGLSFAFLLCAAYLAYTFTNPTNFGGISDAPVLLTNALIVAAASNTGAMAATIAVLTRRFPALGRDAQRRGVLLLLVFPLVNALIIWLALTAYPSYGGSGRDRVFVAATLTFPYIVIAMVLIGATWLLARRYLPAEPQHGD